MSGEHLQIAVIGAGRCDTNTQALAEEVGRLLAKRGCVVVCGGLGGVMEAVARGASEAGGKSLGGEGIVRVETPEEAVETALRLIEAS